MPARPRQLISAKIADLWLCLIIFLVKMIVSKKISMTTVIFEEGEKLVTGFYVPSKFNQQSLPSPLDRRVFINQMNHAYYAVIRFRGRLEKREYR